MFRVVVVRQAWVEDGQTKAWFHDVRQRRGHGSDVGRSRADDDRDGDPGQTMTKEGEGTGTRRRRKQT